MRRGPPLAQRDVGREHLGICCKTATAVAYDQSMRTKNARIQARFDGLASHTGTSGTATVSRKSRSVLNVPQVIVAPERHVWAALHDN